MPEWTKAQECAIEEKDKMILVSAAAGSGKTSVLTERVIRRILDPVSPLKLTDLLIVTFTRSAAADLKSKIAAAIGIALENDPGNTLLTDQLLQLGSAQISTIDSFYLQVVRSNFERFGLPANFRMADENELRVLADEILDELIPEFYKKYEVADNTDENHVFGKIRNNKFADCVDHFFNGKSNDDLAASLLEFHGNFSRMRKGVEALKDSAELLRSEAELPFSQTRCGDLLFSRLEAIVSQYERAVLQDVKAHHLEDPDAVKDQSATLASDFYFCDRTLHAVREKNFDELQNILSAINWEGFKSAEGAPEWSERYHVTRNNFKDRINTFYKNFVAKITPEEQKNVFLLTAELAEVLYLFYTAFNRRYRDEKYARGILDFNDVRDAFLALLSDPENAPLVDSLREQYKEIYIDEYQDVDEIQDEIFAKIGGVHRFMVGDIKQSIYGFRGGDPSIFAGYRQNMPLSDSPEAENADSICIFMSDNFRCNKPVIDFTNAVCSFLFSASPKSVHYLPEDDLKYSKNFKTEPPEPAPVTVRIFGKPEKKKADGETPEEAASADGESESDAEAHWVACEIARLLREGKKDDGSALEARDIAVLARSAPIMKKFKKEFDAQGIPAVTSEGNSIAQSPVFINLYNLLCAIDNPYRDVPLFEFLLSDFGGFTLDELYAVRNGFDKKKPLYDALQAATEAELPLAGKTREFVEWLEFYRRLSTVQSADRFLRILYRDQKFAAAAYSPEFLTVYEQARIYQQSSWTGLYGFLHYLDRLWAADKLTAADFGKTESAVNLMTMHKSKGLEFPVVFVVGCGKPPKKSSDKLIYQKGVGFASDLYRRESGIPKPSFWKEIAELARFDAQMEEEIRLLYVAMTRAKEKLYITATPSRKEENFLRDVSMILRNDRFSILSGKSYIDWIYAALENAPEERRKVDLEYLPAKESAAEEPRQVSQSTEPSQSDATPQNDAMARYYQGVLEKAKSFSYPLNALQGIPTKAAASKLKENLLDILKSGDEAESIAERIDLMRSEQPSFQSLLSAGEQPTAAEIGSATHEFLAECDFANLQKSGVQAELDRLTSLAFLSKETAKIVNLRAIERFTNSTLLQKINTAEQIYREQQFSLFVPLEELTKDPALAATLRGQELFVQGSIDLLLLGKDGKIELYDYKTDRITEEERQDPALLRRNMKARHGNQLEFYARAVEQLFGKRPDHIFIFSLSLGEIVELSSK